MDFRKICTETKKFYKDEETMNSSISLTIKRLKFRCNFNLIKKNFKNNFDNEKELYDIFNELKFDINNIENFAKLIKVENLRNIHMEKITKEKILICLLANIYGLFNLDFLGEEYEKIFDAIEHKTLEETVSELNNSIYNTNDILPIDEEGNVEEIKNLLRKIRSSDFNMKMDNKLIENDNNKDFQIKNQGQEETDISAVLNLIDEYMNRNSYMMKDIIDRLKCIEKQNENFSSVLSKVYENEKQKLCLFNIKDDDIFNYYSNSNFIHEKSKKQSNNFRKNPWLMIFNNEYLPNHLLSVKSGKKMKKIKKKDWMIVYNMMGNSKFKFESNNRYGMIMWLIHCAQIGETYEMGPSDYLNLLCTTSEGELNDKFVSFQGLAKTKDDIQFIFKSVINHFIDDCCLVDIIQEKLIELKPISKDEPKNINELIRVVLFLNSLKNNEQLNDEFMHIGYINIIKRNFDKNIQEYWKIFKKNHENYGKKSIIRWKLFFDFILQNLGKYAVLQ